MTGMFQRSISRRWFVNTVGAMFVVLVVFIVVLSSMVQSSTYNGIEQALTGRMDELLTWLSNTYETYETGDFAPISRDYVESFQDKAKMEIMVLDRAGQVFATSTGFEPDRDQPMPDYDLALRSPDSSGKWVGELNTGEKVMAVTRAVRDGEGRLIGSVRYMVSLERADQQTFFVIVLLVVAGLFIMLMLTLSGIYFIQSILVPVRQVSQTARQIAQGDFEVRIEKAKDDEIGQLCDAVNDMAGELGAAERMKNEFISSVSHELRTPLTAIKGWAETLRLGTDPATEAKGMDVIIRESERLSGLVEELLDFSRLQNGRMQLISEKMDILAELDEAVYLFTERARNEGKDLRYEETIALAPVYGDRNRLKQVFVNIIDNALKYTGEGGSVAVRPALDKDRVRVIIEDTASTVSLL